MYVKCTAGSAIAAAGIGMSALLLTAGPAAAVPLAPPPCDQANGASCEPGPGGHGNGPQGPQGNGHQDNGQRGNAPQGPLSSTPPAPPGNAPHNPQGSNAPQPPHGNPPQSPQGNAPQGPLGNGPANGYSPQPYAPKGSYDRGNDEVGGPIDAPHGFSTPDNGAPPAPQRDEPGWNDGPAPGAPPPNWAGPPPAGGWNGAPPPGGWNRQYSGPPRAIAQAQLDFGPFNYNGYTAIPVFNPVFGGWGYWFFGRWIPLF